MIKLGCKVAFILILSLLIVSCATIQIPSGGAQDRKAPVLLKSYPRHKSTGFIEKSLILQFDEFFNLANPNSNILISPNLTGEMNYSIEGKRLVIRPENPWKPNTTYSVILKSGTVLDFNEGNPIQLQKLIFSTGPNIDSGKMELVLSDRKGQIGNNILAVLTNTRSEFFENKFQYIAFNENNNVVFDNLNNRQYYAFVFADSNQNQKWDKSEKIGFINQPVSIKSKQAFVELFQNEGPKPFFKVLSCSSNELKVSVNQDVFDLNVLDTNIYTYLVEPRTYQFISRKAISSDIVFSYNGGLIDTIRVPKARKTNDIAEIEPASRFTRVLSPDSAVLFFNDFISNINENNIVIKKENEIINQKVFGVGNSLVLKKLDYSSSYTVLIDSQAIRSATSTNKKPITISFTTPKQEEFFREITVSLDTSILKKPSILYRSFENKLERLPARATQAIKNVIGTKLSFHIVIDENANGTFDTGDVEKQKQSEKYYIETIALDPKKTNYTLKISNP
jgi:hypothetical protein